jgi:hypothetical protein
MVLRPDQTLFWFGHRITSPFRVEVRGDSIALNDEPDLSGPRAHAQEALDILPLYLRIPYSKRLAASGVDAFMVAALTDSAIDANAERMAYAYRCAVARDGDGLAAARAAADPSVIDLSQEVAVTQSTIRFAIHGHGVTNQLLEGTVGTAPPTLHHARRPGYIGMSPSERIKLLQSQLREPGQRVIFVVPAGHQGYSGEMARRALAEVDSVITGLLVPHRRGHTVVGWEVLDDLRSKAKRGR